MTGRLYAPVAPSTPVVPDHWRDRAQQIIESSRTSLDRGLEAGRQAVMLLRVLLVDAPAPVAPVQPTEPPELSEEFIQEAMRLADGYSYYCSLYSRNVTKSAESRAALEAHLRGKG